MKQFILSCAFGLSILAAQAQTWVGFTQGAPQGPIVQVNQSTSQTVEFTVEFAGMYSQDIQHEGTSYQRLQIPGASVTSQAGEPELPFLAKYVAIPECGDVQLSVSASGSRTWSNYNVYPVPGQQQVDNGDGTVHLEEAFAQSTAIYSKNEFVRGIDAEIASIGYLRGQKYALVHIYPVQFNPSSQQLQVKSNLEVSLSFSSPTTGVNVNTGILNNVASHVLLNYQSSGVRASVNDHAAHGGSVQWLTLADPAQADNIAADYIIICADEFFEPGNPASEVLRIANHRAQYNGFDVVILNAGTVISDDLGFFYNPTTPEYKKEQRVRTCIRRIYEGGNAQHTHDGKLGYVLLIGDVDAGNLGMPSSYDHDYGAGNDPEDIAPADYYFTCITQSGGIYDEVGDLFVGRFCVENSANGAVQLHNIVEKTIKTETEFSPNWKNKVHATNGTSPDNDPYAYYTEHYYPYVGFVAQPNELSTVNYLDHPTHASYRAAFVNMANSGSSTLIYCGHGGIASWEGQLNNDFFGSNLNNANKAPFCAAFACQTGWLDNSSGQSMGEYLTTYSPEKGFVGYLGASRVVLNTYSRPIYYPPEYQPSHFNTAIAYSIYYSLSSIAGEFVLESKLLEVSPGHRFTFNYFGDPAVNIMAHGYQVTHNVDLGGRIEISSNVNVRYDATLRLLHSSEVVFSGGSTLTIEGGSSLLWAGNASVSATDAQNEIVVEGYMEALSPLQCGVDILVKDGGVLKIKRPNLAGHARITVEEGGTLIVPDHAAITGAHTDNRIVVAGEMQLGTDVSLGVVSPSESWAGLQFDNHSADYALNGLSFSNCGLSGKARSISITAASFSNSGILCSTPRFSISKSTLGNSSIAASNNGGKTGIATIESCAISNLANPDSKGAICISGYREYSIEQNTISSAHADGIAVYSCGASNKQQVISRNTISGCTSSENNVAGIRVYDSYARIGPDNHIHGNENGVLSLNNSSVYIVGNAEAASIEQTQRIMDNEENQVHASSNSFPIDFEYNAIVDEDNEEPLVFCRGTINQELDVRNNHWGIHFNANEDLHPSDSYAYLPIWQFWGSIAEAPNGEQLYASAVSDLQSERFAEAESKSKQLVQDYPDTEYAKAGMKLLPVIEALRNGNFGQLKDYYSQPGIQANDYLKKLAARLANRCDLEQGNYQAAIDWFESVILDPETLEDSVFAIIDLEHTYLMMENSAGKHAGYVGKLSQYKPESRETHAKHRTELMNLLEGNKVEAEAKIKVRGERLIVNKPNPFNGSTVIAYKLEQQAHVCVNVYNISGQRVMTLVDANKGKGAYTVELSASQLPEGIYTYTLELDGSIIERNKMLLVK